MNLINPLDIVPELSALEGSLARATDSAKQIPRLFAAKALNDLAEANQLFARVIDLLGVTPQELNTSARFAEKVQFLSADLKELGLSKRALNACAHIQVFTLEGGIPVSLKSGIASVGELIQLRSHDFLKVKQCGAQTIDELHRALDRHQLAFEIQLPAMQFADKFIPRIRSAQIEYKNGCVHELCYGDHITVAGREMLSREISDINQLTSSSINIEEHGGKTSLLKTYGQLIQILPAHLDKSTALNYGFILSFLTPLGLTLGMQLDNDQLAELGINRVVRVGKIRRLF